MKNIILGITGGISAYKALNILSLLKERGFCVRVVMTPNACEMLSVSAVEALCGNAVYLNEFSPVVAGKIEHIELALWADAILVAPTTYNTIGAVASGLANTMLTSLLSACNKPVFFALAMNTVMYHNPIFQRNVNYLKSIGYHIIDADEGMLACGIYGKGRLKKEEEIVAIVEAKLCVRGKEQSLLGKKVLITAGRTEEKIDPVRYISNHSSGTMGFALAKACVEYGAEVTLVAGLATATPPEGLECIRVTTAQEMYIAVMERYVEQDIVIGCAAVADYTVKEYSEQKIKKKTKEISLHLVPTIDILAELGEKKTKQFLVGFALETEHIIENAHKKMQRKQLDMIIANTHSTLGAKKASVYICTKKGMIEYIEDKDKIALAYDIIEHIIVEYS